MKVTHMLIRRHLVAAWVLLPAAAVSAGVSITAAWSGDFRSVAVYLAAGMLPVMCGFAFLSVLLHRRTRDTLKLAGDELFSLRKDREQLIKFNASIISIAENLHPSKVLQRVTQELIDLHSADLCLILQFQEHSRSFVTISQYARSKRDIDLDSLNVFLRVLGVSDDSALKPRIIKQGSNETNDRYMDNVFGGAVPWVLMVPMVYQGRSLGVIVIHSDNDGPTDILRTELTRVVAHQAAVALNHAQLFQKAQDEIRKRAETEDELYQIAFHDSLTGLPNRSFFLDRLNRAFGRGKRDEDFFYAVVYFDCDNFKYINDSLGHQAGDEVLCQITDRIKEELRPSDTFARIGGDEFVILFEGLTKTEDVYFVLSRIQKKAVLPMEVMGKELVVSVSIGVALCHSHYSHPQELLRDADIAMYRAKMRSKGSFEIFDKDMRATIVRHMEVESRLRRALEFGELSTVYQPIVDLSTEELAGFEALVRWNSESGDMYPDEFIPVAEKCGLVGRIDRFTMMNALSQLQSWMNQGLVGDRFFLSVNLSSSHFEQKAPSFEWIAEAIEQFGIRPRQLHLEITETSMMKNIHEASSRVKYLKSLGVEVKVDDFGTGYSSLTYLARLNADSIKIDKSFVMNLAHEGNQAIVRSIISLSKDMGMSCVAEGVETAEHLEFLRSLGCQYGQGYFFSKPVPPAQAQLTFFSAKHPPVPG